MNTKSLAVSILSLSALLAVPAYADTKSVNNAHWNKVTNTNATQVRKSVNAASVFFIRRADTDSLQTSANISIDGRFQVSLQPNNYSHAYACAGSSQISVAITGNKHNDLLANSHTEMLNAGQAYYFDIDIDERGNPTITKLNEESGEKLLQTTKKQSHQISRIPRNCR